MKRKAVAGFVVLVVADGSDPLVAQTVLPAAQMVAQEMQAMQMTFGLAHLWSDV